MVVVVNDGPSYLLRVYWMCRRPDGGPVNMIVGRNRSSSSSGSTSEGWAQQLVPAAKGAQETCLRGNF